MFTIEVTSPLASRSCVNDILTPGPEK